MRRSSVKTVLIPLIWLAFSGLAMSFENKGTTSSLPTLEDIQKLRNVGKIIATATLQKDVEGILRYDRKDIIVEDRLLLQDSSSDLYCYIFATKCPRWETRWPGRKEHSIYALLQRMKVIGTEAKRLGKSRDGIYSFALVFYDNVRFTRSQVLSNEFLCAHVGKEIATWTFRYVQGQWESVHPPFDAETDSLC